MKTVSMNLYKFSELGNDEKYNAMDKFLSHIEYNDYIFNLTFKHFEKLLKNSGFSSVAYPHYERVNRDGVMHLDYVQITSYFDKKLYPQFIENEKEAIQKVFTDSVRFKLVNDKLSFTIHNKFCWNRKYKRLYKRISVLAEKVLQEIQKRIPEKMKEVQDIFENVDELSRDYEVVFHALEKVETEYFLENGNICDYQKLFDEYNDFIYNCY